MSQEHIGKESELLASLVEQCKQHPLQEHETTHERLAEDTGMSLTQAVRVLHKKVKEGTMQTRKTQVGQRETAVYWCVAEEDPPS